LINKFIIDFLAVTFKPEMLDDQSEGHSTLPNKHLQYSYFKLMAPFTEVVMTGYQD